MHNPNDIRKTARKITKVKVKIKLLNKFMRIRLTIYVETHYLFLYSFFLSTILSSKFLHVYVDPCYYLSLQEQFILYLDNGLRQTISYLNAFSLLITTPNTYVYKYDIVKTTNAIIISLYCSIKCKLQYTSMYFYSLNSNDALLYQCHAYKLRQY